MSEIVRSSAAPAAPPDRAPKVAAPEPASRRSEPEAPARLRLGSEPERPAAPAVPPGEAAEPLFAELVRFLEGVPNLLGADGFPWAALRALVERVIDALAEGTELFWVANRTRGSEGGSHLAFHQARVAVLSVGLAGTLGYDRERLAEVGAAGAVMDVGLWQMRPDLLRRLQTLTGEEQGRYRGHPAAGAALVRRWSVPSEAIAQAVLHHHEREQGQGFPAGLTGIAIHPHAKILGLVDTYTSLTAPQPLGPGLRPHEAVREIVRSKAESFPASHVKALLTEISVFPPGTLVKLNTGEAGRVIAVNRSQPLRPRVEVCDAAGRPVSPSKMLDLAEAPFLYITGAIGESPR